MKFRSYNLLFIPIAIASLLIILWTATVVTQQLVVGPNVQVSVDHPNAWHHELDAGADFTNPNRLIICGKAEETSPVDKPSTYETNVLVYVSHDSGRIWRNTLDVGKGKVAQTDPKCDFGSGGVAYGIVLNNG